uniref:(+)-neomenthol dehydrogenase n=1 Tax=Zea mays TaxID=4577 RepID=A0A804PK60_MAIZE
MEGGAVPKPSEKRVALVTGGNRGMGFEICRQLASSGLTVVLTARSETRGAEAARELHGFGLPDVVSHQLDVTEPTSAARLADFVRTKFGKLDVLVNNAGIMGVTMEVGDDEAAVKEMMVGKDQNEIAEWLKQRTTQSAEQAEECVRINYHGTKTVTEALLPLVQSSSSSSSGGRIVNVTSSFGLLRRRGAPAGAEQRRHADHAAPGRAVGAVPGGLQERPAGAPRMADRPGVRGVPGVQGARLRLRQGPRQGQPRAAGQLRAPGLRPDGDEPQHRGPHGRGRRQGLRRRRSRRPGRRHRRLLRSHSNSFVRVILECYARVEKNTHHVYHVFLPQIIELYA